MELSNSNLETRTVACVFVGNPLSFSDTAMTLVETELPCIKCDRTAAVSDLLLMGQARSDAARLLVIDEAFVDDLIKVLPQLRAACPMANIVVAYRRPEIVQSFVARLGGTPASGKVGFLPMNLNIDSWLSVVRLLATGEHYFPVELFAPAGSVQATPTQDDTEGTETAPKIHLTAREMEVLKSAAEGKQNKIIADELRLSQHTVKLHMHHIIAKLGVHNRTEAANWFHGHSF